MIIQCCRPDFPDFFSPVRDIGEYVDCDPSDPCNYRIYLEIESGNMQPICCQPCLLLVLSPFEKLLQGNCIVVFFIMGCEEECHGSFLPDHIDELVYHLRPFR